MEKSRNISSTHTSIGENSLVNKHIDSHAETSEVSHAETPIDSRVGNRGKIGSTKNSQVFQNFELGTVCKNEKFKIHKNLESLYQVVKELKNKDCSFICYNNKIYPKAFINMWNDKTIIQKVELLYAVRHLEFNEKSPNFFNFFNFLKFFNFWKKGKIEELDHKLIGKSFYIDATQKVYGVYIGVENDRTIFRTESGIFTSSFDISCFKRKI